jgi:hypothetical protein
MEIEIIKLSDVVYIFYDWKWVSDGKYTKCRVNSEMTRELVDGEIDRIIDKDDVGFMKLVMYRAIKQFREDAIEQERLIWGSRAERVNEIINKLK